MEMHPLIWLLILPHAVWGGVCPSFPFIRDFDFTKYTGLWYQQDKQQSGWEAPGRCWQSLYVRDATTGQYKMKILYENTITGNRGMYESSITLLGPSRPSVIKYSIPYTFMDDTFQVLATDYESYSIEYQCDPNGILAKSENVFLLTREKTPPAAVLQKAYAIMHRYGLDIRKLERIDQTCGGLKIKGVIKPTEMMRGDLIQAQFEGDLHQAKSYGEEQEYYEDSYGSIDRKDEILSFAASSVPHGNQPRPPFARRNPGDPRRRIKMGQSLATRLWHILHYPAQ